MNKYAEQNNKKDNKKDNKNFSFVNEKIHANLIHVVDDGNGKDIGNLTRYDALKLANEANLDLVQICYNNGVSICKICDYGKYLYMQKQKAKLAKKRAKASIQDLKEVCFSIRIDDGDKNTKVNHIKQFLADNCKVRLTVQFSKREMSMLNFGKELMKTILIEMNGLYEFDVMPKTENRSLFCIIKPIKK